MVKAVQQLADELLDTYFSAYPIDATLLGFRDRDDQLPDFSEAHDDVLRASLTDIVARGEVLDRPGCRLRTG